MTEKTVLTTNDVAKLLHCSPRYVAMLRDSGLLGGIKLGRTWLYHQSAIDRMFAVANKQKISGYDDMCAVSLLPPSNEMKAKKQHDN